MRWPYLVGGATGRAPQLSEHGPCSHPPAQAMTSRRFAGSLPATYMRIIAHDFLSMPLICLAFSLKSGIFDSASPRTASVTPQLCE